MLVPPPEPLNIVAVRKAVPFTPTQISESLIETVEDAPLYTFTTEIVEYGVLQPDALSTILAL
jgi:hypothetical protein